MQLRLSMVTLLSCISLSIFCAADDGYKLIRIRNMTHENSFSIMVQEDATVGQLKELIEEHEGVPVKQQRLEKTDFVEGCCLPKTVQIELEDGKPCSSYDFRRHESLRLYGDNTKKLNIEDMMRERGFYIKYSDDMTINQVKHQIQKCKKIPVEIQVLQKRELGERAWSPYRFIILEDDKPCSFYNFRRYDVVQLTFIRKSSKVATNHVQSPQQHVAESKGLLDHYAQDEELD